MLIEENGYSMEEALDTLYKSHTYEKLERESTGLYTQGAVYVMEHLKEELVWLLILTYIETNHMLPLILFLLFSLAFFVPFALADRSSLRSN